MGGAIEMPSWQLAWQLCSYNVVQVTAKKFLGETDAIATSSQMTGFTAVPLCVSERQEGDLVYENDVDDSTGVIQAVAVRRWGW